MQQRLDEQQDNSQQIEDEVFESFFNGNAS